MSVFRALGFFVVGTIAVGTIATTSPALGAQALVVEPNTAQALVVATARGEATTPPRDVTIAIAVGPRDARSLRAKLPRYDSIGTWATAERRRAIVGDRTFFTLTILRPSPAKLAAFIGDLETRFVREHLDARVWSVVARARDCALLDARALDFARERATRDAVSLARAADRELGASVASEDVTPGDAFDRTAAAHRCTLGAAAIPAHAVPFDAPGNDAGRIASVARIAVAFGTTPSLAPRTGTSSAPRATRASETTSANDDAAPPLFDATDAASRLRLDFARLGPTIAVVGTSARLRPATIVRYSATIAAHVLAELAAARARLHALGIGDPAIVARVRAGATPAADLFVDVPASARISGEAIAAAIGGADARVRATVGETLVRGRCDELDARAARESIESARARANDLARALGTTPRAPLAFASRGVVAPGCTPQGTFTLARPRGSVVGGPQRSNTIATYASTLAAFALVASPPRAHAPTGKNETPPESFFRAITRAPRSDEVELAIPHARPALRVTGIGTARVTADRAELNVTIAADPRRRIARVDPLAAYALAAPLERIAGRAPTRIVARGERAVTRSVALHLELRAPLDETARTRLRTLLAGARRLGRTNVQLVFAAAHVAPGEALARRRALADAALAAARDTTARKSGVRELAGAVEAEPYIERDAVRDTARLDQRVAIVVRIDITYTMRERKR